MRRCVILLTRELRSLFLSPVAWSLLFLVWLLSGVGMRYFVLPASGGSIPFLVSESAGIAMGFQLFLVPLVTMRMLAEERRIGTFEMLVTTPARDSEIVLAKWFAAVIFLAVAWLTIPIYALIVMAAGGEPDFGPVLSSFLVICSSGAALAAVGLLASAVSRQQLVAGFLGLSLIMLVFFLPEVARAVPADWHAVHAVLAVADLRRHVAEAGQGIFDVVALAYHLALAGFVLLLTLRVLEIRKWT